MEKSPQRLLKDMIRRTVVSQGRGKEHSQVDLRLAYNLKEQQAGQQLPSVMTPSELAQTQPLLISPIPITYKVGFHLLRKLPLGSFQKVSTVLMPQNFGELASLQKSKIIGDEYSKGTSIHNPGSNKTFNMFLITEQPSVADIPNADQNSNVCSRRGSKGKRRSRETRRNVRASRWQIRMAATYGQTKDSMKMPGILSFIGICQHDQILSLKQRRRV